MENNNDASASDADIEARARALAATMGPSAAADLRELQDLTTAVGLPAVRALFRARVEASQMSATQRKKSHAEIARYSAITDDGCMQVDFHNRTTGRPDVVYLRLKLCRRDHDLGAELARLQPHVSPEKWQTVLRHMSMIVFIGRTVYGQFARANVPLLRRLRGAGDDDDCAADLDVKVDMANTTLYVDPAWDDRLGLFIDRAPDDAASSSASPAPNAGASSQK